MLLQNKIALVTGGTGGLGSVVCKRLLDEGCMVYATVREQSNKRPPDGVRPLVVDVTNEEDIARCFSTIMKEKGRLDILVNTVGGYIPRAPVKELSVSDWEYMMNLNLRSAFLCTREALRAMEGKGYGRIINLSAMVGVHPTAGRSAYGISKAGVILLSEVAAQEVKETGITVNVIAPSIIDTPANRSSMPGEDFRRWTKPEEIAGAIVFLCSDEASAITGTVLKM